MATLLNLSLTYKKYKMKFKELQQFIDKEHNRLEILYKDQTKKDLQNPQKLIHHKRSLGRIVKLNEEVGELCEAVMCEMGLQRQIKLDKHKHSHLEDEIGDVIITTLLLAKELNVDVTKSINNKMKKINKRKY